MENQEPVGIENMISLVIGKDNAENITKFPFGPEHNIIKS